MGNELIHKRPFMISGNKKCKGAAPILSKRAKLINVIL